LVSIIGRDLSSFDMNPLIIIHLWKEDIININTWLLQNFLEVKRIQSKVAQGQKVTENPNYILLDNYKVENIFRSSFDLLRLPI
jgi:hypothetical protein